MSICLGSRCSLKHVAHGPDEWQVQQNIVVESLDEFFFSPLRQMIGEVAV